MWLFLFDGEVILYQLSCRRPSETSSHLSMKISLAVSWYSWLSHTTENICLGASHTFSSSLTLYPLPALSRSSQQVTYLQNFFKKLIHFTIYNMYRIIIGWGDCCSFWRSLCSLGYWVSLQNFHWVLLQLFCYHLSS